MSDRIGQQFGNYRLIRLLGQGGTAAVYLGEDVRLHRQVTIKVLDTLFRTEVERFQTEARTLALLDHPHIVRILDFGVQDTTPYLVMEYGPGATLRTRHPKGTRLPLPTVVSYVKQIADALQYAHDRNVIHGDVKPENMLLGPQDEVLLSGFDISTMTSDETPTVIGTPTYMAPEQWEGRPVLASDQYALAVVVYEWLTGSPPFEGTSFDLARQHVSVPPPPLREKVPTIPLDVEKVVLIALAKNPAERFRSMRAFANALEQASDLGSAISPPIQPPGAISPSQMWADRTLTPPFSVSAGSRTPSSQPPVISAPPPSSEDTLGVAPGSWDQPTIYAPPPQSYGTPPPQYSAYDASSQYQPGGFPSTVPASGSPPHRSSGPARPSFFTEVGNALTNFFSGRGSKKQQETQLSLFAIARTSLENDDRAIVGKEYTVQAGISQHEPEGFRGEPFRVSVQNPLEPLPFSVLIHPGENIELMGARYQRLRYDPRNIEPQFVFCPFRVKSPGQSYLLINFYRERQWLKTIRFEFDGIKQAELSTATPWR